MGTRRSWSGIMSVARTSRKRSPASGKRSRAKAYPARLPSATLLSVTMPAMTRLLVNRTSDVRLELRAGVVPSLERERVGMIVSCSESGSVLNDVMHRPRERDEHQERVADQDRVGDVGGATCRLAIGWRWCRLARPPGAGGRRRAPVTRSMERSLTSSGALPKTRRCTRVAPKISTNRTMPDGCRVAEVELPEDGVVEVQDDRHQRRCRAQPSTPPAMNAWSNSWSAPMTPTVATKKWPGRSSGNVMRRNACHGLAPSIAAAS